MTMIIDNTTTVRDVVVNHPETRAVFESFGVDYCCGGGANLADAVSEAGVDLGAVIAAVQQAMEGVGHTDRPRRSWADAGLAELAQHIETTHHVYTKKALPRLADLFTKVVRAHGKNHGDVLRPLQTTFSGLRDELEPHLMKEEQVLFPYIRQMEASLAETGRLPPMHCGTVQNPIRQMKAEHENAGEALSRMRSLTDGYALPEDACPTFHALFDGLRELEADLHEHIHLENNILFPRAVAMEAEG